MTSPRVLTRAGAAITVLAAALGSAWGQTQLRPGSDHDLTPSIAVLSSRPDMISGDDALIEVRTAAGTAAASVVVTLNSTDITRLFHADARRQSVVGLVTGLRPGRNLILASTGSRSARLELTAFPLTGPIVSGPHLTPFECRTIESGLGPPLDADCTAAGRVDYFYRSTETVTPPAGGRGPGPGAGFKPLPEPMAPYPADLAYTTTTGGVNVPYVVRVESGTINRSIYRIAILDDPQQMRSRASWSPGRGWNQRLIYTFGGGCGAGYHQGSNQAVAALFDPALSRGFAHAVSTQNVLQLHCSDQLSAEALMMIKEHFIERYGVPVWTMGFGGSGGAIQQLLIAQNFPGLLDGIVPGQTFPDSYSVRPGTTDCRLLKTYFDKRSERWTAEKRSAVEGYTPGTCDAWDRSYTNTIVADYTAGCAIGIESIYDRLKNPKGARCTTWDTNVATFGRDPATGFARRTLDNVGIQYGLRALNAGAITPADFIDLNANIGGYDNDGHLRRERSIADPEALRLGYAAGRVNAAAGLGALPILHIRPYLDAAGDIHSFERDFAVRARIAKAAGRVDNQVIWVFPAPDEPSPLTRERTFALAIETMAEWLDALVAEPATTTSAERVRRARPAAAVDACWDRSGTKIAEPATYDGGGRCHSLYPPHANPRLVAGAPIADDILKCRLKPIDRADYRVPLTAAEIRHLGQVFPGGVCDFSKPGIGQQPPAGTYLTLPLRR
jgi:hypothetical protein